MNTITKNNSVVAIYNSHAEAEAAVKELQQSGFDMKKLSIVGRDYHTDEHVVGYYNVGDRVKYWGKLGAFWGGNRQYYLPGGLVGGEIALVCSAISLPLSRLNEESVS